ncbi:MAG: hypothetical protein IJS01_08800 [Lentisphaeria bacterium]|nr:hypothetical protein [Lentisphaeria bacterium]
MKPVSPAFREAFVVTGFAAVILALATACHGGGYLHWESSAFLLNYTADRPLAELVFDPARNDWGLYQCRELSYFFDWIDARIVFALLRRGIALFLSPVCLVLMLGMIFFQQYAGRRLFPRLPGLFFTLHGAALALLPCFCENIFFRSSKFLAAAGLLLLVFGTALRRLRDPGWAGSVPVLCAAAVVTVLADRQGMFFVTAFTGLLAVMQFLRPCRAFSAVLAAGAAAVVFGVAADLVIAPRLIELFNGYTPDFAYQGTWQAQKGAAAAGLKFALANTGQMLAGIPSVTPAAAVGAAVWLGLFFLLRRDRHIPPWLLPGSIAAVVLCCGVMAARHPAILSWDIVFSSYFLPSGMALSFFWFAALERLPAGRLPFAALLPALAVCLRLAPYLQPERLFHEDKYQKIYQEATVKLRQALADPACDERRLCLPYRMELLLRKVRSR